MFNGKYVKIDSVIEKVYRDLRFAVDLDWIDILEWTRECMEMIGVPEALVEKITDGNESLYHPCPIDIVDYRGKLPTDIYQIISAREKDTMVQMQRSTDAYHLAYMAADSPDLTCASNLTYKINNSYIFTNFETGCVEISYLSFLTDERGYPLIPDNAKYKEAIKWYIGERIGFQLFLQNKIDPGVYSHIYQQHCFYMGAAKTSMHTPDYDKMNVWRNMFNRMIPDLMAERAYYKHIGDQEQRFNSTFRG